MSVNAGITSAANRCMLSWDVFNSTYLTATARNDASPPDYSSRPTALRASSLDW